MHSITLIVKKGGLTQQKSVNYDIHVWAKSIYLNGTKLQTGSFLRGKWLTCSWTLTKLDSLATVEWFRKYFIID